MRYSYSRPLPEPKPFFWIPLKDTKCRGPLISHESFTGLSGYVDLEVKVISDYLYVGSGSILWDNRYQSYYAFARRNGKLVIPATGMKGPVRSIAEAISDSCVSQTARMDGFVRSKGACRVVKDQEVEAKLCPACKLFGTTGYMGRVHFTDAIPTMDLKPDIIKISDLWPPRQALGRKFYQAKAFVHQNNLPEKNHRFIEAVPKDSAFKARLLFENTNPGEMGLLMRSIGLGFLDEKPNVPLYLVPVKIGGAKPRCLGAVRFVVKGIHQIPNSKKNFFSTLAAGGEKLPIIKTLQEWLMDKSLLDEVAWLRFSESAKITKEPCPKELY